ncbi:SMI1/KNR4 family protein [Nocardiopsis alborubida]|uniref:SMI1/KNR4 family protein n=1 Tax=Nocardiopsis alborubida TaxID=146802 RepID=A0A7X6MF62_9ACTN|nr:SMI1/KNR4 family protein [Nocardiopsis alborubida]NKZ00414.1 SMI1/KNR4 family protein [Nocardiopsis alborubida]
MTEHTTPLAFSTERRRVGAQEWTDTPQLNVLLEPGEPVSPARIGWRDREGGEAAAVFDPGMDGFTGTRVTSDGVQYEWRGTRVDEPPERPVHRFRIQGGDRELRLLVEDGGPPLTRLDWADREGGGGTVLLRAVELESFVGPSDEGLTRMVRSVRAGDEYVEAGEVALNLLDATSGKWLSRCRTDRLDFTMSEPVTVRRYMLDSANDFPDRDPADWSLLGSSDGQEWTLLDARSGESFPGRHLARDFTVSGPGADTPWRCLRLEVTRNAGAGEIQLNRVRFFAEDRAYEAFHGLRHTARSGPEPFLGLAVAPEDEDAPALPATVEEWRTYLTEYSADMLRVAEAEGEEVDEEERTSSWFGDEGAPEERIAALEERLGRRLPPSYRSFLAASDGWGRMGAFVYEMSSTAELEWDSLANMLGLGEGSMEMEDEELVGPLLLVSSDTDAQYWILDAGDVSPDGEWAAYIWASWYPGLGDRHRSFASLVHAERVSFEELSGGDGHPVRSDDAEELLELGRREALAGNVDLALTAFDRAETRGSAAAAYLKVVLSAFLEPRWVHHELRRVLSSRVVDEIGVEQIRTEAVPLALYGLSLDSPGHVNPALVALREMVPGLPEEDETGEPVGKAWLDEHRVPEPPEFEEALETARGLAARGARDEAWAVIEEALPGWYPTTPNRIAPVVLLTDPALRGVVTRARAREAAFTARGVRASA